MHYFLSKLLPLFLLPPGCFFVLFVIGFTGLKYSRKFGYSLLAYTIVLFYLVSIPLVSSAVLDSWENQTLPDVKNTGKPKIAVVLGGMFELTNRSETPYLLNDSIDRIFKGIELIKTGRAQKLIFTGGYAPYSKKKIAEATLMLQFVRTHDLLADSLIWIENQSINTYENALNTAKLLKLKKMNPPYSIYLITSAYHMPRSVYTFNKMGFEIIPVPTDFQHHERTQRNWLFEIIPQAGSMFDVSRVMREWMGLQYYKFKFWLD